ncbi:apolipoprotein N-acyltransferase [Streptomyces sp. TRM66268-LWL]|uniref:Apolipoprotein N-acyltransferase n=1 Tax=Streptomyces polyasparticus TaxID=2767826 RepID=A0ABR7STI1_9ACTN|nr:apolipoprotein N-acyltransferase [Streptomyces polyasparticus]MBC9718806.1 apolipoprotein N-acyltransferase [Streptomyces polyasparticus]
MGGSEGVRESWARRLRSPWWRGLAAVAAGALPAPAFPEPNWWWFAYVALVPWLLLVRSAPSARRAGLDGWLGGTGFMLAMHHWLAPNLHVFTVVIAALLGLLWLPWGLLVRHLLGGAPSRTRAAAALAVVPSAWLIAELVRSWEGLGGPWGLLGSSQWQLEPALRLASVGGVWLVTLVIVAVNTGVALLLVHPPARLPAVGGIVVAALVTTAVWAWAPRPEEAGRVRVALVQPGTGNGVGLSGNRFDREEALTRTLVGRDVDLVVWGESSVGFDLATRTDLADRLARLSREVGAEILVNVDARRSDKPGIFKSSVLVGPEGPTGARYDKMRLVPFGEYVPARSLLGWATSVGEAAGEDRRRGTAHVVMPIGEGWTVGPLVCFESAFPDMSRQLTRRGAQLLLAQSATSSFQDSWAPEQHASLAAMRAAENGRPMVHATLTGVSAVYAADGSRIGEALGTEERVTGVYDIPLTSGTTPFVRFGDWAVYAALGVLAVLLAFEGVRAFRQPAPPRSARSARTAHASPVRPVR